MPSISPRTHTPSRKPRRSTWFTASASSRTPNVGSAGSSSNSRSKEGWLIVVSHVAPERRAPSRTELAAAVVERQHVGVGCVSGVGGDAAIGAERGEPGQRPLQGAPTGAGELLVRLLGGVEPLAHSVERRRELLPLL